MTTTAAPPLTGPLLLAGAPDGPALAAHRARRGPLPRLTLRELEERCRALDLRGRGGAGFPLADKLATAARSRGLSRPVVVVNASEGEPASHKDATLVRTAPHLVLDGAVAVARALGAREVHLVTGGAPGATESLRAAARERDDARFTFHRAAELFVAGQSAAVLELVAGRPNLPVATWQPAARSGLRGRPTLLSNAETFAVAGLLALHGPDEVARHGTALEPGTTLLTIDGDGPLPARRVVEVAHGTRWDVVLGAERLASPVLLGGYHGTWAPAGALLDLTVSRTSLAEAGLTLGAGVVLPADRRCPVRRTAELVDYLAAQSARRCGPCLNGLPALAAAFRELVDGHPRLQEVRRLAGLVDGRGACAHPDGTARLVRSLLVACPDAVDQHLQGTCAAGGCG
jgi:NADH:ubiquinone oxidoreductase subunit F (NADH-binding)